MNVIVYEIEYSFLSIFILKLPIFISFVNTRLSINENFYNQKLQQQYLIWSTALNREVSGIENRSKKYPLRVALPTVFEYMRPTKNAVYNPYTDYCHYNNSSPLYRFLHFISPPFHNLFTFVELMSQLVDEERGRLFYAFRLTKNKIKTKRNNNMLMEPVSMLLCDEKFTTVITSRHNEPIRGKLFFCFF